MQCDMCGKDTATRPALVEGTEMQVCENCIRFGKPINRPTVRYVEKKSTKSSEEPTVIESIVSNYDQVIKAAREKRKLTQEEFAKQLNVKESLLHSMESRKFKPSPDLARKLEKVLHIKLVESITDTPVEPPKLGSVGLTIGDIIQMKQKKK